MQKKIDLMIIGAQKSGTTSLLRYLGEHPQCTNHPQKEFAFFVNPVEYGSSYKTAFKKYFFNYTAKSNSKIIAKSANLYSHEEGIKHLYEHNPKCKIVLILRDPVQRSYSSYMMERNFGSINYEFDEIFNIIERKEGWEYDIFIKLSLYVDHIKTVLKYFPKEQLSIYLHDNLINDSKGICKEIFKDLHIDTSFIPNTEQKHNTTKRIRSNIYAQTVLQVLHKKSFIRKILIFIIPSNKTFKLGEFLRNINKTDQRPNEMSEKIRLELVEYFKPSIEELEQMLGLNLENWKK